MTRVQLFYLYDAMFVPWFGSIACLVSFYRSFVFEQKFDRSRIHVIFPVRAALTNIREDTRERIDRWNVNGSTCWTKRR